MELILQCLIFVVAVVQADDTSEACRQMVDPKVVRIAGQYDLVNLAHQVQNVRLQHL